MSGAPGGGSVTPDQTAGLLTRRDPHDSPRLSAARARTQRWIQATGAHLLVVDPGPVDDALRNNMATLGVHVTVVSSTIDALVQFGRTNPAAVIISPDARGLGPSEFTRAIRRFGTPFVIASLDSSKGDDARALMLAGCSAVVERPYDARAVWRLLEESGHALGDDAMISFGPIELDARAFTVRVRGDRLQDLPLKEFELLRALMRHAPQIVSNDDLRHSVWGPDGDRILDNTLAVHVARLRHRLQGEAKIRRIRRRGYSLSVD